MVVFCGFCKNPVSAQEGQQLIPCLHTFCMSCLLKNGKKPKVCPVQHCMSPVQLWPDIKFNSCENTLCLRKTTPSAELLQAVCLHSLCADCVDKAKKRESPVCPIANCGSDLVDLEDSEHCEGECKAAMESSKLNTLSCCQMRMCVPCMTKWTEGKDICPLGKCNPEEKRGKKTKKSKSAVEILSCCGEIECEGQIVLNFPSDGECDHTVCMNCLSKQLDECQKNNKAPNCPADICHITYRCDSVLVLRELFPARRGYFNRFELSSHYSGEIWKDDQSLTMGGAWLNNYYKQAKLAKISVAFCEDEDNVQSVYFDLNGPLGDLLVEIKRVLKILPIDRVYGYLRRDGSVEKPMDVATAKLKTTLNKMNINENTLFLVNITGIVSNKQ